MKTYRAKSLSRPDERGFVQIVALEYLLVATLLGLALVVGLTAVRETSNKQCSDDYLKQISQAQKNHFTKHRAYAASFETLGLKQQKCGYNYSIELGVNGQSFVARGVPAAPGVTASQDGSIDQTNNPIVWKPNPQSDQGRRQMYAGISSVISNFISSMRSRLPNTTEEVVRGLQTPTGARDAFKSLDSNGDGVVTITEMLTFRNDRTGRLNELAPLLKQRLQIGLAGEDVSSIPGVTFGALQRPERFSESEIRKTIP